jgi:hypothetical protein
VGGANLSSKYFISKLKAITPSEEQVTIARKVRLKIEKRLVAARNDREKTKFHFYRTKDFGSFSKGLAIHGKSDIDILALFNLEALLYGNRFLNSKTFLTKVKSILNESDFADDLRIKGPSIVAKIDGVNVDIVPGTFYGKYKKSNLYYIPNFNNGWMVTAPDYRNTILNKENNNGNNDRLKKTIKLIKHWAYKNNRAKYLSSFYLEAILTDPKIDLSSNNINDFITKAFRILKDRDGKSLRDPHSLENSLIPISIKDAKKSVVASEIEKTYIIITKANTLCKKGQHDGAVKLWKKVFG